MTTLFRMMAMCVLLVMLAVSVVVAPEAEAATFNVKDYGAAGNGSRDDTDSIRAALDAAKLAGGGTVYVPGGTYMVRASTPQGFKSVHVYDNIKFVGAGTSATTIKLIANTVQPGWVAIRMIVASSNTTVSDMTVDGSRDSIDSSRIRNSAGILIASAEGSRGSTFARLRIRNQYSHNREGFGLALRGFNHTVRNVESYNNNGSGISVGGGYYDATPMNISLNTIQAHHNGHMGVTMFGARGVSWTDVTAYNNTLNGINIEWSRNITVLASRAYDNGRRGINGYGWNTGIRVERLTTNNNGANHPEGSEAGLLNGYWNEPNPVTGKHDRSITQDIAFIDCTFTRAPGKHTMYIKTDRVNITLGSFFPKTILMPLADSNSWTFRLDRNRNISRANLESFTQSHYGVTVDTN